jgi:hypothetical protein
MNRLFLINNIIQQRYKVLYEVVNLHRFRFTSRVCVVNAKNVYVSFKVVLQKNGPVRKYFEEFFRTFYL